MYHKQQIFDFGADQDHVQNPVFFLKLNLYHCEIGTTVRLRGIS